jgi:hypothetical protein
MNFNDLLKTLSLGLIAFFTITSSKVFGSCDFFCDLPNRGGSQNITMGDSLVSFMLIAGIGVLGYRIFRGKNKDKKM